MWPVAAITLLLRAWSAYEVAWRVLRDPLTRRRWWWVPVQDIYSFAIWFAGFFGNHIIWRGRKYYLHRDGRFERVSG
jgi:ceramide glucosyltransferase